MTKFYVVVNREDGPYVAQVASTEELTAAELAKAVIEGDFQRFSEETLLKVDLPLVNKTVYDVFSELIDEIVSKDNRIQVLSHERNQFEEQLRTLSAEADTKEQENQAKISALQAEKNKIEEDKTQLNQALTELDAKHDALSKQVDKLNQELNDAAIKEAELLAKLALFEESDEAHAKLVRAVLSIDRKLSILTTEATDLRQNGEANRFIDYLNVGLNCLGLLKK